MAVGFDTGNVEILDSVTLQIEGSLSGVVENQARFDYSNDAIKHMCFSHDNTYLACSVSVFSLMLKTDHISHELWYYMTGG